MKKVYTILMALTLLFGFTTRADAVSISLSTISLNLNPTTGIETGTYSIKFTDSVPQTSLLGVVTGKYIDITGLGSHFDGSYLVTASTHQLDTNGYSSDFTVQRNSSGLLNLYHPNYLFSYTTISNKKNLIAGLSFFPVPEASTILLLGSGLTGLWFVRRRFSKRVSGYQNKLAST